MSIPSVLVMKQDSLLNSALTDVLKNSKCELKVITSGVNDVKSLIAGNLRAETRYCPDWRIHAVGAGKMCLGHLLMSNPELQVIIVSEDTNWVHIFHKKDKLMTRQTDLLDVLCVD